MGGISYIRKLLISVLEDENCASLQKCNALNYNTCSSDCLLSQEWPVNAEVDLDEMQYQEGW